MIAWLSQYSGYIVLVAFFSAFASITFWVYWPKNKQRLESYADIPLKGAE